MDEKIKIDGKAYTVSKWETPHRVFIKYPDDDGLEVLAGQRSDGVWELSGDPARGQEMQDLKVLEGPDDVTQGKTTLPDGTVERTTIPD